MTFSGTTVGIFVSKKKNFGIEISFSAKLTQFQEIRFEVNLQRLKIKVDINNDT